MMLARLAFITRPYRLFFGLLVTRSRMPTRRRRGGRELGAGERLSDTCIEAPSEAGGGHSNRWVPQAGRRNRSGRRELGWIDHGPECPRRVYCSATYRKAAHLRRRDPTRKVPWYASGFTSSWRGAASVPTR